MKLGALILLSLLLLAGCVDRREVAVKKCQELCRQALSERRDLSRGPCLSNEIVEDWCVTWPTGRGFPWITTPKTSAPPTEKPPTTLWKWTRTAT